MITIEKIQKVVEDYYKLPAGSIQIKTRKREIVQARQIAMDFSKKKTKETLNTIGVKLGNKDHATVMHACKVISDLSETDKIIQEDLKCIEKLIDLESEKIEPEITIKEKTDSIINGLCKLIINKNEQNRNRYPAREFEHLYRGRT